MYELFGFKKVTVEVGLLGLVITTGPGPVNLVHKPLPTEGVFPFKVNELIPQSFTTDWVTEAVVAGAEAVIITVSLLAAQPGVDKLHSKR